MVCASTVFFKPFKTFLETSRYYTVQISRSSVSTDVNIRVRQISRILLTSSMYRKIPKISPGAYIFQRPFLRGLVLEGLIYGGKFAFQNRLGLYLAGNLRLKIHWVNLYME